jgi:hypothetical protein
MPGGRIAFFGIVRTPLVRNGQDVRLPRDKEDKSQHTRLNVYTEMLLQACRDYAGLPDPRTLTESEIRFFYNGLRKELKEHTKPKEGK